jgi:HEPN domain-containing protein
MILTIGLIKADLVTAGQAIEYFEATSNKNIKNIAAYHLQQATEKLIKYQIYRATADPNNTKLYTHNIEKLIVYADSLDTGIDIPVYVRKRSLEIIEWEAGSRYDIGFTARIDTLKRTYSEIENWIERMKT